jgi:hypothetical protein
MGSPAKCASKIGSDAAEVLGVTRFETCGEVINNKLVAIEHKKGERPW